MGDRLGIPGVVGFWKKNFEKNFFFAFFHFFPLFPYFFGTILGPFWRGKSIKCKRNQFYLVNIYKGTRNRTKCLRPYLVECTSSRPITEVKQPRARLVLGWVTAGVMSCKLADPCNPRKGGQERDASGTWCYALITWRAPNLDLSSAAQETRERNFSLFLIHQNLCN